MNDINILNRESIGERIKEIKRSNPNAKFYSHSRLGNFNQCRRGYYYTYINKKEQKPSVYALCGEAAHTSMERLYTDEDKILNRNIFNDMFDMCNVMNIPFPKSKYDIGGGYFKDINACYDIYKKLDGERFVSELGFILKLDENHYINGFIDLIRINSDGTADIYDFKTSTDFDSDHLKVAGRQLILYKLAIEQLYNIKVNTIAWIMMKYLNVKIGSNKEKVALRGRDWVSKCSSQISKLMKNKGYDLGIIEMYISQSISNNSIDNLPDDIKSEINVNTYIREYDPSEELMDEFWDYYHSTIDTIESMNPNNISEWECNCDDEFYKHNLCSFYPKHCTGE